MKYYHYTPLNRSVGIKDRGLKPYSKPLAAGRDIPPDKLNPIAKSTSELQYICALDSPEPTGWVESGLYEILIKSKITDVGFGVGLFEFQDSDNSGILVRDHSLWTPTLGGPNSEDIKQRINYLNSTTPLLDYSRNFSIPEFWIPREQKNVTFCQLPERAAKIVTRYNSFEEDFLTLSELKGKLLTNSS